MKVRLVVSCSAGCTKPQREPRWQLSLLVLRLVWWRLLSCGLAALQPGGCGGQWATLAMTVRVVVSFTGLHEATARTALETEFILELGRD